MRSRSLAVLALLAAVASCGEAGSKTADVVQAATKSAAEVGQQLADKAAELAQMAPEKARAKGQELLDTAARALREVRDSEAARRLVTEVERLLDKLVALGVELGRKLDLAGLQQSVADLVERFKSDPRVVSALESLREKLDSLTR